MHMELMTDGRYFVDEFDDDKLLGYNSLNWRLRTKGCW